MIRNSLRRADAEIAKPKITGDCNLTPNASEGASVKPDLWQSWAASYHQRRTPRNDF